MKEVLTKKAETMEDTKDFARAVCNAIHPLPDCATVLTLSGDLGSGKTTFMKMFASLFGIDESEVTSPTFVIAKRYPVSTKGFTSLVHMDAYRIEEEKELETIRFDELLKEEGTLVCIEWPEKIKNKIPSHASAIVIEHQKENERDFTLFTQ